MEEVQERGRQAGLPPTPGKAGRRLPCVTQGQEGRETKGEREEDERR